MADGASKTACFALLEAFNRELSSAERKELLLTAIRFAMESTGHRLHDKPEAADVMLRGLYEMIMEEGRPRKLRK